MVSEIHSPTATRVEQHTPEGLNEQFRRQIEANAAYYAQRLDQIEQRLQELDREWDIERLLAVNAGAIGLAGLVLSLVWRKTSLLSAVVAGFMLQHAVRGWCPPVSVFRRLGIRTWREIDKERYALKALRGDFQPVDPQSDEDAMAKAGKALGAAQYPG